MLQSHSPKFRQVEVPQIEYEDQVVQVPVQKQVQVPHVQTVQKTVEIPQIEPLACKSLRFHADCQNFHVSFQAFQALSLVDGA